MPTVSDFLNAANNVYDQNSNSPLAVSGDLHLILVNGAPLISPAQKHHWLKQIGTFIAAQL